MIDALMKGANQTATNENLSMLPHNNIKNEPSSLDHCHNVALSSVAISAVGTGIVTKTLYKANIPMVYSIFFLNHSVFRI